MKKNISNYHINPKLSIITSTIISLLTLIYFALLINSRLFLTMDWYLTALTIMLISFIWNFAIQYAYYKYCLSNNPKCFTGLRPVTHYASGIIGDAIILPILNLLILKILFIFPNFNNSVLLISCLSLGFIVTLLLHYFQAHFNLLNWSMAKKWEWNLAGLWHIISAPVQFAFFFYGFGIIIFNIQEFISKHIYILIFFILCIIFFLITFLIDYITVFDITTYFNKKLFKENDQLRQENISLAAKYLKKYNEAFRSH